MFFIPVFDLLEITQIPKYNVFTLVASIGGSLGLFVGVSFIHFVEAFVFIVDLVSFVFCRLISERLTSTEYVLYMT